MSFPKSRWTIPTLAALLTLGLELDAFAIVQTEKLSHLYIRSLIGEKVQLSLGLVHDEEVTTTRSKSRPGWDIRNILNVYATIFTDETRSAEN
uniref:Uncharacterized protein n=1 Tax=Pristionchus pacificus TaxID=54126 RepID=A0A2A6C8E5_PRIPA|eukprot:PDM74454.1 hypothetical protein PRIPAC_41810 [Pristionchus pacificus]